MQNPLITTQPKSVGYYKGLLIHADPALHEQMLEVFRQYVPEGSSVLDLGAGAGAFSLRLHDNGYRVTGLDACRDEWTLEHVPFVQADLNRSVADVLPGPFDAVCCQEVIEHVENPWQLVRQMGELVKPGGVVVVSTPNVTSFYSRIVYLLRGRFPQFTEESLTYGHINPINAFEMCTIAERSGFEVLEVRAAGYLPVFDFSSIGLRSLAVNALRGVVRLFARGHKNGTVLIFVLRSRP